MRLYLDASVVIYTIERIEPWKDLVRARLARPDVRTVTSELSVLECKVRPLRLGQRGVVAVLTTSLPPAWTSCCL